MGRAAKQACAGVSAVASATVAANAPRKASTAAAAPPAVDYVPGPYAAVTLLFHCLQKSAQVGAVVGLGAVALAALRGRARGAPLTAERGVRLLVTSLGGGTAVLGAASAARIATLDADGVADRVYRLHHHAGQERTDRLANAAGLMTASVAAMALPAATVRLMAWNMAAGFAVGTAGGVAGHVGTSLPRKE
jgi:hypothetical protein